MADDEETGQEESVYESEEREKLLEDDEISAEEQGFMEGAEELGQKAKCANCGKALVNEDEIIEKEYEGETKLFDSDDCVLKYEEKLEKRKKK